MAAEESRFSLTTSSFAFIARGVPAFFEAAGLVEPAPLATFEVEMGPAAGIARVYAPASARARHVGMQLVLRCGRLSHNTLAQRVRG